MPSTFSTLRFRKLGLLCIESIFMLSLSSLHVDLDELSHESIMKIPINIYNIFFIFNNMQRAGNTRLFSIGFEFFLPRISCRIRFDRIFFQINQISSILSLCINSNINLTIITQALGSTCYIDLSISIYLNCIICYIILTNSKYQSQYMYR